MVIVAVLRRVPPANVMFPAVGESGTAPRFASELTLTTPALITMPPPNVLVPPRTKVPPEFFTRLAVAPARFAEMLPSPI